MAELTGKRALVCGSTQGIGRACAEELARRGATVTLAARNEASLRQVCGQLSTNSGQSHDFVCADFADSSAVKEAVARHLDSVGAVHILVNNTGGPPSGPILEADAAAFLSAVSQHVVCNHLLVQLTLPGMKESKYGRIINIVSTSVMQPIKGLGVSNTTRAAVANWAKTVATEVAPFGITVNCVLPGFTDTARLEHLFEAKAKRQGTTAQKVREEAIGSIPMGRLASPVEIAAIVGFLASPAASYVSGVNLPVDGARLASQ